MFQPLSCNHLLQQSSILYFLSLASHYWMCHRVWLIGAVVCSTKKLCACYKYELISSILTTTDLDHGKSSRYRDAVYLHESIAQGHRWPEQMITIHYWWRGSSPYMWNPRMCFNSTWKNWSLRISFEGVQIIRFNFAALKHLDRCSFHGTIMIDVWFSSPCRSLR